MPVIKDLSASAGDIRDTGSIPGLGRAPGGTHGHALQHSCLEDPMDRGAWRGWSPGSRGTEALLSALWCPKGEADLKRGARCAQIADSFCCAADTNPAV